jgi:hypothetical protein
MSDNNPSPVATGCPVYGQAVARTTPSTGGHVSTGWGLHAGGAGHAGSQSILYGPRRGKASAPLLLLKEVHYLAAVNSREGVRRINKSPRRVCAADTDRPSGNGLGDTTHLDLEVQLAIPCRTGLDFDVEDSGTNSGRGGESLLGPGLSRKDNCD